MSQYYKPDRNPNWNYGGGKWRLSRSKIDLFTNCQRCFYIDNKLGTARPPGFPFNLNSAVDALLKKEFDMHRVEKSAHPIMEQYGVDAVPLEDPRMDEWRDSLRGGIVFFHKETKMTVCGGVDDVWVDPKGALIIVDYKATSKDERITALDQDWHSGYKKQMEVYQWLFRKNGFQVSDTGYFVYANADKDKEAFDGVLEFEVTLIPHKGDDSWVEDTILAIHACLENPALPPKGESCDYCTYRETVGKKLMPYMPKKSPIDSVTLSKDGQTTLGL